MIETFDGFNTICYVFYSAKLLPKQSWNTLRNDLEVVCRNLAFLSMLMLDFVPSCRTQVLWTTYLEFVGEGLFHQLVERVMLKNKSQQRRPFPFLYVVRKRFFNCFVLLFFVVSCVLTIF